MTMLKTSARIETLIDRMTLAEKIGQMTLISANLAVTGPKVAGDYMAALRGGRIGTVSVLFGAERIHEVQRVAIEETRLGIPLLFALDVIHGHRTVFPIPLAEACSFDPKLWETTAHLSAVEATADGVNLNYAPMLDVSRDPRWGRIAESPGEDPHVACRFAQAKIKGLQGDDISRPNCMAATAKHLAGYGAATAGRDYASVDVSMRTLLEVYMPPFKAAIEAGVAALMPGFHDLAGEPMTANAAILDQWVRGRLGFQGVMISDYNAIPELLAHGVAKDLAEAAAAALLAGIDIDLMGDAYRRGLPEALERKLITMAPIDQAVRRILTLKEELGLFDAPFARGMKGFLSKAALRAHRQTARIAATRSIVLLTNKTKRLPLQAFSGTIALIGPLADNCEEMMGPWSIVGRGQDMVSIREGLEAAFPANRILCVKGVEIAGDQLDEMQAALDAARAADVVVLAVGEAANMSGEAASRGRPGLPGRQEELARALLQTGKPLIVLLTSGRPLLCAWLFEQADAVLATWFLGSEAGHAIADILSGKAEPTGRLPVSWPVEVGQIPITYDQRPTGRPPDPAQHYSSKYLDLPVEPMFAFGHGLSYTEFSFGVPNAAPVLVSADDEVTIETEITNRGQRAGRTTAFLFIHDPVASLARPGLELKGFEGVNLAPGESKVVRFSLSMPDLTFLGRGLEPTLESGVIEILVGPSADRRQLQQTTIRLEVA